MKYADLLATAALVHNRKTHDYAEKTNKFSNFTYAARAAKNFPDEYKPFVILIAIKLARLAVLLTSEEPPENESITDSFIDLINYSTLFAEFTTEGMEQALEVEEAKADYTSDKTMVF